MSSFISRKDNAFFYSTADFIEKIPKNGFYAWVNSGCRLSKWPPVLRQEMVTGRDAMSRLELKYLYGKGLPFHVNDMVTMCNMRSGYWWRVVAVCKRLMRPDPVINCNELFALLLQNVTNLQDNRPFK